ncbi:MAG: hypothetical protein ACE5IR_18605, partial [bacterium]
MTNLSVLCTFVKIKDDFVQQAKEELKKLETRRKLLQDYINTYDSSKSKNLQENLFPVETSEVNEVNEDSPTIRERLISVIKTLVEKKGKSVRVSEMKDYIQKNNVNMGDAKNVDSLIRSILSQEIKKSRTIAFLPYTTT